MKQKLMLILLFLLISMSLLAAGGRIFGEIKDAESGAALEMVSVRILELKQGASSDRQGKFMLSELPAGEYTLRVDIMGYEPMERTVKVVTNATITEDFLLSKLAVEISGRSVNALRSVPGETPVAFTELSNAEIAEEYTTQDVPELIDEVPGVFAAGSGLGESELSIRGFDAEKVQVLINGIPVNDPESQKVYWSNWTGLSSNINSVQVQRGASSSLYGSGAFGGSLNIETMKSARKYEWSLRSSVAAFASDDEIADGEGGFEDYQPYNYNTILRFNSGELGPVNFSLMVERKQGDSYIIGTNYDGWSFGADGEINAKDHKVNLSLIAAPQSHNQARTTTDRELIDTLGRNYNRSYSGYQENYYYKPQFSVRDEWTINDHSTVMTNMFVTAGDGGGKYLKNDYFDVETGEVREMDADMDNDRRLFGKHAAWIYETTGTMPEGLRIDESNDDFYIYTYQGEEYRFRYTSAANLIAGTYENSWENDSENHHNQFGINSYYQNEVNRYFEFIGGYEFRYWLADHFAESNYFHYALEDDVIDQYGIYDKAQVSYDYSSVVRNLSGFLRFNVKPVETVNLMADIQAAQYYSEVDENKIQVFDFGTGEFLDEYYYTTKEMMDGDSLMFDDSDYERTWDFISPKFGLNYKPNDKFNMFINYSIAHKEPKVKDWYSYKYGPNQDGYVEGLQVKALKPEKVVTYEFGYAYRDFDKKISLNVYNTRYLDKIGTVTVPIDGEEQSITANYGDATHQGIELSFNGMAGSFDYNFSGTLSRNRWNEMDVEKVGNTSADELIGNVVPFAPERMASGGIGYTVKYLPLYGKLHLGLDFKWWDEYYCNEENEYSRPVEKVDEEGNIYYEEETFSSKLPFFFTVGAEAAYDFKVAGRDWKFKLDFNNINNREANYTKGYVGTDYGRNDYLLDEKNLYVVPAPLFSISSTIEIKF